MTSVSSKQKEGFTIIEVMLFLAISALMMIGAFAAIKNSINNQRYSTAVSSLQSYFQTQYNQVINVRNDRTADLQCSAAGIASGGAASTPGTGICSIIGRYIRVNTAKQLISYPVYATRDVATLAIGCQTSDQQAFSAPCLNLAVNTNAADDYDLAWDTSLKNIKPGSAAITALSIFLYRSPLNSQVGMVWSTKNTTDMATLLANVNTGPVQVCVNQAGWTTAPTMGVQIDSASIGSSNAISRISGGSVC